MVYFIVKIKDSTINSEELVKIIHFNQVIISERHKGAALLLVVAKIIMIHHSYYNPLVEA